MENFTALNDSFKSEMAIFDELAKNYLDSDVELINQIANHIVNSGGKKLRPILMFYCKNLFRNISKEAEINVHKMGHRQSYSEIEIESIS